MKNRISLLVSTLLLICPFINTATASFTSQDLIGAWNTKVDHATEGRVDAVITFAEGYMSTTYYSVTDKKFVSTIGGAWSATGGVITEVVEYHTADPSQVGTTVTTDFSIDGAKLMLGGHSWARIDYGTPGALAGAYLITGRKRDGELKSRPVRARKTMKILSGKRFQWIAYNTDTGEFFGTGGGTYTTENGKYTEHIDFFSRDGSRVGASLEFDFEMDLAKGEWHHSGLSSKGSPIYEVWTVRSILDKR